jgi:hypothetical protein
MIYFNILLYIETISTIIKSDSLNIANICIIDMRWVSEKHSR